MPRFWRLLLISFVIVILLYGIYFALGRPVIPLPAIHYNVYPGQPLHAIVTADGELPEAGAGQAVTLTLEDEIDASRGDVIAAATARPEVSDQFAAHLIWMHEDPLLPGRPYVMKIGTRTVVTEYQRSAANDRCARRSL